MTAYRSTFLREVTARGFLHQCTDLEGLDARMAAGPAVAYIGFDATADSLHVGSLVQIMLLRHLQRAGHRPIVLMGGGTTKVGDPSGKDESRRLLSAREIHANMAGIKAVHVPYKGLAPATLDLLSGNITMSWESTAAATPYIRNKRLRALGIGSAKRSALMPDIPTISESGLKGFELGSWSAMFAPAATPPEIVRRLQREVAAAVADRNLREQFAALGAEPVGGTPEELASVLKHDIVKWAKIARQANVQAE